MNKFLKKMKPYLIIAAFFIALDLIILALDRYFLGQEIDELFLESKSKYLEAYKTHDCYTELEKQFAQIHEDAVEESVYYRYIFSKMPGSSKIDDKIYTENIEKMLSKLCK